MSNPRYQITPAIRKKMSDSHIGKTGYWKGRKRPPQSKEWKAKIGLSLRGRPAHNKGVPCSEEMKKKISKTLTGYKHSNKTKNRMSKARSGEKHWNWQGGKTAKYYSEDWVDTLRESIRIRDNYICIICYTHQDELTGFCKKLDIHHINYNKQDCNPDNLISLCRSCHAKTNYNRDEWIKYFHNLKIASL